RRMMLRRRAVPALIATLVPAFATLFPAPRGGRARGAGPMSTRGDNCQLTRSEVVELDLVVAEVLRGLPVDEDEEEPREHGEGEALAAAARVVGQVFT